MGTRRKVAVLTGTRADYGIYKPVLREIMSRKELALRLIVTGMHLAGEFGKTIREIEADGFPVAARVDMLLRGDTQGAMAKSLAIGLLGITQALEEEKPDLLLVLGDRGEMLAGAIAAAHLRIATAHLHGGELSGSIDGSLRHAITRFAHLHFPVTQRAAQCIAVSGEERFRIIQVGVPGLDDADQGLEVTNEELQAKLGFPVPGRFALVVFHPVLEEAGQNAAQAENILNVALESDLQCLVFLPNSDAGREAILQAIKIHGSDPKLHCIAHLPRRIYLGLLARATVMIGNSSSGIIEAPYFKLPVINIGARQQGRERAGNVIDIDGTEPELRMALAQCLNHDWKSREFDNPYRGGAGTLIADTLASIAIDDKLLNKNFTFLG
jgi:GDP/UDP-N,N'-diacetylbacillosamine 2-epimerase (hydrolysing)